MRAITRVPEPPVAPITNGAKLATPTLATVKAGEQYPALPQFQHVDEKQPRNCVSRLGRGVDRSRRELYQRKPASAVSDILDDRPGDGRQRFTRRDRSRPVRLPTFGEGEKDRVLHLFARTDRDRAVPRCRHPRNWRHIAGVRKGGATRHRHSPGATLFAGRFSRFSSSDAERGSHATWPNHLQLGRAFLSAAPAGGACGIRSDTRLGAKIPGQGVERSNLSEPGDGAKGF